MMKSEIDIIRELSFLLEKGSIPYMLTGSIAMNYYAMPRMTRDIDVVMEIGLSDISTIMSLFEKDYYVDDASISDSVRNESMFNIIHNESLIKIDCIVRKTSQYRKTEFERRVKVKILDFETYIVSLEDLILSKLFRAKDSRSEIQLNDVRNLLSNDYNDQYLQNWAHKLDLKELLDECLHG